LRDAIRCLTVAACLAIASSAGAFQREMTNDEDCTEAPGINCPHRGTPLAWRAFPVRYFVNSDSSGLSFGAVRDAVSAAFSTWQDASDDGIPFEFAGQTHEGSDGQDGRNTVSFPRLGENAADTFAQSIITYDSHSGEIFDVDIELNGDEPFAVLPDGEMNPFDPRVDVQAVTTHESGHLLGLAHENRFGSDVVMFFSDTSGSTQHRTLASDDRSGVRAIYPESQGGGGDGGGGGCSLDPSSSGASALPVAAMLAAIALRRRPSRRG
jgi:matrixin